MSTMTAATQQFDPAREATKVTLVGMWVDIALGIGKIAGGVLGNSFALITDGIHSLTDVISDVFVLAITHISHAGPDEEHPWGHGRFETIGTIAMGVLFFTTAGILLYDSVQKLSQIDSLIIPTTSAIVIAIISILSKEWIFHYTMRVANKLNSNLLRANAWHSRSDALSSVAVTIGIGGAMMGYTWMDTLAAIVVALIIAKIGWGLCFESVKELVDTAVPRKRRAQIESEIRTAPGIEGITSLRSRSSGGKVLLEVSLKVDPKISVSDGHDIGESVSKLLTGRFTDIADVIVHIDPNETSQLTGTDFDESGKHLPEPQQLLHSIKAKWSPLLRDEDIESMDLNYLDHGVEIDLTVKLAELPESLATQLKQAIMSFSYVANLRIYTKSYESSLSH